MEAQSGLHPCHELGLVLGEHRRLGAVGPDREQPEEAVEVEAGERPSVGAYP